VIQNGGSCEVPLAQNGALTCAPGFACAGTPGSRTCRPAACNDGLDNDGDGIADFPNDPGCTASSDTDESDSCPSGADCPACSDGIDDDGDGLIDYPDDTACSSASSVSEACPTAEPIAALVLPSTVGTTDGASNDFAPQCGSSNNTAGDLTYSITVPALSSLTIDNVNNFDAVVELYDSTCGGSLQCNDTPETITLGAVPAGTYYYVIDGYSSGTGSFTINISGTIPPAGSCEGVLADTGALTCEPGYACQGATGARTCQPTVCNDGTDNDGDGHADYPGDPGCTSISDTDETDDCPSGPNCPVCSNSLDDDSDGQTDYPADTACLAASGTSEICAVSEPVVTIAMPSTPGTTVGSTNDVVPDCGSSSTQTAGDNMYSITVPALSNLSIAANTVGFDAAVSLLDSTCGGTAVECEDFPADVETGSLAAGTYYISVDGYSDGAGAYTLDVSGTIENGASCESPLVNLGVLSCAPGYACKGTMGSRTCEQAQCSDGVDNDGDGITDYGQEPGCSSVSDDDETDPATPAACANTTDDDGDGTIDFPGDVGCAAVGAASEVFCPAETDPLTMITMSTTNIDLTNTSHTLTFECQGNTGHDQVLGLSLPVPVASLTIDTIGSTSSDTVVELLDPQCTASFGCDDDGDPNGSLRSSLTLTDVPMGNYGVAVAGYSTTHNQPAKVNVHGTLASGTRCDSALFTAGVLVCDTGLSCTGTPATCQ
jgi:hypothetical protein